MAALRSETGVRLAGLLLAHIQRYGTSGVMPYTAHYCAAEVPDKMDLIRFQRPKKG